MEDSQITLTHGDVVASHGDDYDVIRPSSDEEHSFVFQDYESTLSADSTRNPSGGVLSADKQALAHVLDNLFDLPPSHPVRTALDHEGIEMISDIVGLMEDDIDKMQLPKIFKRRFTKLLDWYYNLDEPTVAVWFSFTSDQYASYVPSYAQPVSAASQANSSLSQVVPDVPKSTPQVYTQSAPSILPGVKRNVQDFPKLTKDDAWFIFKRNFQATACAQALWHVFNPDPDCLYIPVGEAQIHL